MIKIWALLLAGCHGFVIIMCETTFRLKAPLCAAQHLLFVAKVCEFDSWIVFNKLNKKKSKQEEKEICWRLF